jgi:adenylosuccinate lyase
MPHKRNPITAENLCGLARVVRAQLSAALESVTVHNEQDISHSSVERIALPLVTTLTEQMVTRAISLLDGLEVDTARMSDKLQGNSASIYSGTIRTWLMKEGMPYGMAWRLSRMAVEAANDSQESLAIVVPRLARQWEKSNKLLSESAPGFNPNWVDLVSVLNLANLVEGTRETFEWFQIELGINK